MQDRLKELVTEQRNPHTLRFDECSSIEMLRLMNEADGEIARAVAAELESLSRIVDAVAARLREGGRLFYIGAGNGGRLAMLDARECVPTFNTPPEMVQSLLAGGVESLFDMVEGAEDDAEAGILAVEAVGISTKDAVFALAASGRTPFVIAGARRAKELGALVTGMSNNPNAELTPFLDIGMEVITGPEVIQGSTRLKAGTAQKMVMNMLSTCVMTKLGKVYQNMMVDVVATNYKLVERSLNILQECTGASIEEARTVYEAAGGRVKESIIMYKRCCALREAQELLRRSNGFVSGALEDVT